METIPVNPRLKSLTDFIGGERKPGILDTIDKQKALGKRYQEFAIPLAALFAACHCGVEDDDEDGDTEDNE